MSEFIAIAGVDVVGRFPDPYRAYTCCAAGIFASSNQPEQARRFIDTSQVTLQPQPLPKQGWSRSGSGCRERSPRRIRNALMGNALDFSFLGEYWPALARGVAWTLMMTCVSLVPGAALGVLCALARVYGSPGIARFAAVYVEIIRNTPSLIQAFWLFFGLASIGLRLSPFVAAVLALSINFAAYVGEIIRAGLEATPRGEIEAADCLGLTPFQRIIAIELPQTVERMLPALIGQSILMMLSTSILYQISAEELTGVAWYIQSFTFRSFEVYLVVAVLYVAMTGLMRALLSGAGLLASSRFRRLRTPL